MPKQTQLQQRELTRKESARRRREDVANRRMMIALGAVAGLLLAIIAVGVIQELVLKPRQPVATVNGAAIGGADYAKRVLFAWYQEASNPTSTQPTDPQTTSLNVLDQMIEEKLLREQAQQRGITVSTAEVDEALEKAFGYQRNTPTPSPTPEKSPTPGGSPTPTPYPTSTPVSLASYQEQLKTYVGDLKTAANMSEADLRVLVEIDLLRNKLYEAVTKDVPTTEEQVHARHILVRIIQAVPTPTPVPAGQATPTPVPAGQPTPTPTPAPRDEAQALARIVEVQQKLGAGGDFATLAKEYSDDPGSAEQGGDLGWFGRGQMVTEFDDAAFKLAIGQLSDPIKTTYGYHILQVLEKDPARAMDPYTAEQKKYEAYTTWVASLKAAANIANNWSAEKVPPTPNPLGTK